MVIRTSEDLGLDVGTVVNVEVLTRGSHLRSDTRVIGYLPGQSVLVTMPAKDEVADALQPGTECILRYLHRTTVAAFRSSVLAVLSRPYGHLHLRYPNQIDRVTVRRAERIRTSCPASFRPDRETPLADAQRGTIVDISTGGAQVVSGKTLGPAGQHVIMNFSLSFSGMQRDMELEGITRNTGGRSAGPDGGHTTGVEFVTPERDAQIFLNGFIYEQISQRRGS